MNDRIMKVGRVLFWAVFALFAVLAISAVILQAPQVQQEVLEAVTEQVNQSLDGEFSAERLSGSLLADFTLHDVRVTDERGREVLSADEVEAEYSLVTWLLGQTRIDHLGLHDPVIHVTREPDGTVNLSELAKEEDETTEPAELEIDIYRLSVTDGKIVYEDQSDDSSEPIIAREVEMTGSMPLIAGDELIVNIAAAGFELEADFLPRRMSFYATGFEYVRTGDALTLSLADLSVDRSSELVGLMVNAELTPDRQRRAGERADQDQGAGIKRLFGRFESFTIAPSLAEAFAPDVLLDSPVTLEASFQGDPEDLRVTGSARTRGGEPLDFGGSMSPEEGTYELSGQVDDFDVQAWMEVDTSWSVERGNFTLSGDGERHTVIFDGSGVRAQKARFKQLDGRAVLSGSEDGGRLNYDVAASGSGVSFEDYSAGNLDVDLEGSIVPAKDEEQGPIDRLIAEGSIGIQDFGANGIEAGRIDTDIDVSGGLPALNGAINTTIEELGLGDQGFAGATVALDLREDRRFGLDMSAAPDILPQLPLFLRTSGSYGEDFNTWRLAMLELGRPGFLWRMPEPNRVFIEDGKLTVDSLVLQSGAQSVTLDGTYDLSDPDSLESLFEDLAASQLKGLLDPDQLRERIPDELGDELPDELDRLPEDLDERVPDEVDDLLPGRLRELLPGRLRQ